MKPLQSRPSPRLLFCVAALALTAAGAEGSALFMESSAETAELRLALWDVGWIVGLALFAAACFDWLQIRRAELPIVSRTLPNNLALRDWAEVAFAIDFRKSKSRGSRPSLVAFGKAQLFDHHPDDVEVRGLPIELIPEQGKTTHCSYQLRPLRRGDAHFAPPTLLANSPLGFWRFTIRVGKPATVRVYPNFAAVARFGNLALGQHTRDVGIKLNQRRGQGLEFHQLREYRQGDTIRQIDWKATSRKQQLVSREYQDERDQRVIFLLDCSRRMRSKDGEISHFDHSLNAMILLSHVALKGGDAVGILSFGKSLRWLPPQKGVASVNRILNTIYDLESSTQGSDFSGAAEELCRREPRRSLVILITNLRHEDVDDLVPGIQLLRRRHLVLVANLREQKLDQVAREPAGNFTEALRAFGALQHQSERARVSDALGRQRTLTMDVLPRELSAQLINRYYAIKRGGEL